MMGFIDTMSDRSRWSRHVRVMCMVLLAASLGAPGAVRTACADELDLLPDIQPGDIEVSLNAFGALRAPSKVTTDANGRLFVTELGNDIVTFDPILQGASQTTYHTPAGLLAFNPQYERGMTTVTLHPDFLNPGTPGYGKFYTIETNPRDRQASTFKSAYLSGPLIGPHMSVIYEYTADDPAAATFTGTKRLILSLDEKHHSHNIDDIAFGPNGLMYFSTGDHGNESNDSHNYADSSRDLNEVYGKILRIDPLVNASTPPGEVPADREISDNGQYSVPTDNPFFTDDASHDENDLIWAFGMRNPFRIGFDSETGDLYSSDTGQHNIESINHVQAGHDYGWNLVEGSYYYEGPNENSPPGDTTPPPTAAQAVIDGDLTQMQFDAITFPTFEYDHQEGETAIGGFVYHGDAIPQLVGKYVFGDFVGVRDNEDPSTIDSSTGPRLFYGDLDTGEIRELIVNDAGFPLPDRIVGFGEAPDGELYFVGFYLDGFIEMDGSVGPTGKVYQILPGVIPEPGTLVWTSLVIAAAVVRRRRR